MNIIAKNPYRYLGVYSNSPTKERVANKGKMNAFLKVGKSVSFPLDLPYILPSIKRTIETIANAESELRTAGLKVSFLNSSGKPESWKYQGGSWTEANFIKEADGGNKILTWITDAATTRKQVAANERKAGMQISYLNPDKGWINEQYVGTDTQDFYWGQDDYWDTVVNTIYVVKTIQIIKIYSVFCISHATLKGLLYLIGRNNRPLPVI